MKEGERDICESRKVQAEIGLVNGETNKQRLASVRKRGGRYGDDEGKNWIYEGEEGGKK